MKLRCELLTVKSPELTNGNKFNLAIAETNVIIDWVDEGGTNHATAAKAVYTYVLTKHDHALVPRHLKAQGLVHRFDDSELSHGQASCSGSAVAGDAWIGRHGPG